MLLGLGNGAVFKLVPEHFPKDTGTVTGLVGALGGLGGFFPPLLLGVFRDQLGAIWPGFVLLSLTAFSLRIANERVFRPADVEWTRSLPIGARQALERVRAGAWATLVTAGLAAMIVVGSRSLQHFDAALVGYTFATLFATFGISYRYAMWLNRPPTRMYWRRGWQAFFSRRALGGNAVGLVRRALVEFAANAYIFRRGRLRGLAHWLIMWGCVLAAAITFPLVWGWIHFETVPGDLHMYRTFVFGLPVQDFPVESVFAFVIFHGLVWSSFLVIAGVMLAFRRRMVDHGAVAVQQFGQDILPLLLLFAISVTGLMLTASYTWMRGYGYEFLAILHAATVIVTLLWLPFGKLFHVFQRPAQLGVGFYKDAGRRDQQALCRRCGQPFASVPMVRDLTIVEHELGFRYELPDGGHYQDVCPKCRRALFGLAQGALWREFLNDRPPSPDGFPPPHGTLTPRYGERQGSRTWGDPGRSSADHQPFRPAPVVDDRRAAVDERRTGAARQDALLLLRPAVRHSAQGARQPGDRLRAVGGLPVQSRDAVPERREALPAGLAS